MEITKKHIEEKLNYLEDNADVILNRIKKGGDMNKYLIIHEELNKGDIRENSRFQENFSSFFKIRRRNNEWKKKYFDEMEKIKKKREVPSIKILLEKFEFENVEFFFATKLNHILSPDVNYIYDNKVRKFLNIPDTRNETKSRQEKISECTKMYNLLEQWYKEILGCKVADILIKKFDKEFGGEAKNITESKKIDFFLWKAVE